MGEGGAVLWISLSPPFYNGKMLCLLSLYIYPTYLYVVTGIYIQNIVCINLVRVCVFYEGVREERG